MPQPDKSEPETTTQRTMRLLKEEWQREERERIIAWLRDFDSQAIVQEAANALDAQSSREEVSS